MLNAERFKASICLIATYFLSNPFPVQAAVKDSAPKVTAAYVKNLVQQKSIGSVESLLAHLPEHFRSSFVLMHKSRSIQEATYLNPRVILMSSKGLKDFLSGNDQSDYKPEEVLMSFNGGGHHFGSESVEMIQWRQDTKSYELSEILFRDGKANFSGTNPSQCLTCHSRGGQSPTPIWDTYFTWPGAYGANDGIIKYGTEEDGGFRAFVAQKNSHPRYRHLIGLNSQDNLKNKYDALRGQAGKSFDISFGYWIEHMSGYGLTFLSQILHNQNVDRIDNAFRASPKFEQYKKVINCATDKHGSEYFKMRVPEYFNQANEAIAMQIRKTDKRGMEMGGFTKNQMRERSPYGDFFNQDEYTSLAWVGQNLFQMDPTTWSYAAGDYGLNFVNPGTGSDLSFVVGSSASLSLGFIDCEKEVRMAVDSVPESQRDTYKKSRLDFFSSMESDIQVPQVALLCASCHGQDSKFPIPFQSPDQMKSVLSNKVMDSIEFRLSDMAHSIGMGMPYKSPPLSQENKELLIQYLHQIQGY